MMKRKEDSVSCVVRGLRICGNVKKEGYRWDIKERGLKIVVIKKEN